MNRLWMGVDQPKEPHPEPCAKVMGSLRHRFAIWGGDETVVAGCTGRRLEILSNLPRNRGEIPFLGFGGIDVPVFALMVNVPRRDIGFKMALRAGVRLSRNLDRELVSCMTGTTGPVAPIGVDPPSPLIGPLGEMGDLDLAHLCF